jgi:ubiquinone/menaquinone biosynthesis C-methylase UbiE
MAFSDPVKNLNELGIHPGSYIADLGAGSGAYSLAAAHMVGKGGKVFAVDVQGDLVSRIKNAAAAEHVTNIEAVHGDIEELGGTRLQDVSIDAALASNVLFQVEQKASFIDEIKRILKPNGRVLVVDWADSFGGLGPQKENVFPESDTKNIFEKHGFAFVKSFDAGDHHYGLIFRKD